MIKREERRMQMRGDGAGGGFEWKIMGIVFKNYKLVLE